MVRVAVTGASGLLGGNLVLALSAAGHQVHALRRSVASTAHLPELGIHWHSGDLADAPALDHCFADAEVVFHCAAAVSIADDVTPLLHQVNVEGTRAVMAAVAKGSARLVYTSSTVAVGLADNEREADENSPWNFAEAGLADGYCRTKKQAEDDVMAAVRAGTLANVVVVNPGYMFGAWDSKPSSGQLLLDAARGRLPMFTRGRNSFVDVEDVVRSMIAAWTRGRHGERYILGGHNICYEDVLVMTARCAGRSPPRWAAAPWMTTAASIASVAWHRLARRSGEPLLTRSAARWSHCQRFVVNSAKATTELGHHISPLQPSIERALAWWQGRGQWL
jgi:dihydroflavonol-4-reductase